VVCVSLRVMGNTGVPKAQVGVGYGWVKPARTLQIYQGLGIKEPCTAIVLCCNRRD
jgi:hypothetical protein